ncbi:hypothetical protein SAMD00019534_046420 [Acytostelium subglobosum LB1]|uniref:hypothetical protein n=1 Tax=Acytostelium subglobosum LB1 TaxID=1410327 RepID=UPI000644DEAA|nr:hypothetical protein SAMD00019534_046420 [Acytostelium subglobosum LB1]GAM21467.1 hypothetical protein SAMD00019534_046420 [Acytostelium subglobosum LB1]|eukprot:XP_012755586.1 hypothetical protein SAMD00019534_046420 [Acytostelium subglobosum LB1]
MGHLQISHSLPKPTQQQQQQHTPTSQSPQSTQQAHVQPTAAADPDAGRPHGMTKKQYQRVLQQQASGGAGAPPAAGGRPAGGRPPQQQQQAGGQPKQQAQPRPQQPQQPQQPQPQPQGTPKQQAQPQVPKQVQKKEGEETTPVVPKRPVHTTSTQYDDPKRRDKVAKKKIINAMPAQKLIPLFAHLPQFEIENKLGIVSSDIHPEIISLGLKYATFTISGSNARAVALMTTLKQVIRDFHLPADKDFVRELNQHINPLIQFLVDCRSISISMSNSIVYFKQQCLSEISNQRLTHEEAKERLYEKIDSYIERIGVADRVITKYGVSKIKDGDVILTYASSHVVEMIIQQAQKEGKKFRVIVVDSRPKHEGKELLHRLVRQGVKCTYILLNAISYIMKEVTKVFVGACSILSNGNLLSRAGTALVASMAHFYNVPFIVCCETYKFTEKAQLDSICSNDLGDPNDLASNLSEKELLSDSILKDWKNIDNLKLLNPMYDLTPIELIDMVITEFGMVPPTSIPVILREYRKEITI